MDATHRLAAESSDADERGANIWVVVSTDGFATETAQAEGLSDGISGIGTTHRLARMDSSAEAC